MSVAENKLLFYLKVENTDFKMCHKGKITSRYSHRITVIKVICTITNKLEFYAYVLFLCLLFHTFMASSSQFDARNLLKENFLHAILFPVDAGHEAIY